MNSSSFCIRHRENARERKRNTFLFGKRREGKNTLRGSIGRLLLLLVRQKRGRFKGLPGATTRKMSWISPFLLFFFVADKKRVLRSSARTKKKKGGGKRLSSFRAGGRKEFTGHNCRKGGKGAGRLVFFFCGGRKKDWGRVQRSVAKSRKPLIHPRSLVGKKEKKRGALKGISSGKNEGEKKSAVWLMFSPIGTGGRRGRHKIEQEAEKEKKKKDGGDR